MTSEHFKGEDLEARMTQLEEALALLRGDSTLRNLPYGTLKETKSHLALRSVGGALGGAYPAGVPFLQVPMSTAGIAANHLYAIPFFMPGTPNTISKIGISVTSAAGSVRLGIYEDKGEPMLYPHKLLLDAGAVVASSGVRSIAVEQGFPRGLVWVALIASATPTLRVIHVTAASWALLGASELGDSFYSHYKVSQAFGALPNPFPAGATEQYGRIPYVFLKFS